MTSLQSPKGGITSRPFESERDLVAMRGLLMEGRSRTNDWLYWHVGELIWSLFLVVSHLDPRSHVRLWHDGRRLVGYAVLGEDPPFECQVLPEVAYTGIEEEALAWAASRSEEVRAGDPKAWEGGLVTRVRQDDARRIAFLEAHGFRPGAYTEVNLLRSLSEPIAEPAPPEGFCVRAFAGPAEAAARADAERLVWQPWPTSRISGDDYLRLMKLPAYRRDLDLVAVAPDGTIASYVNGWLDPVNRIGDFGPVGTLEGYRRLGLARAVQLEALRRMKKRGMDRVCISTGMNNDAALHLYLSVGFAPANHTLEYVKAG